MAKNNNSVVRKGVLGKMGWSWLRKGADAEVLDGA